MSVQIRKENRRRFLPRRSRRFNPGNQNSTAGLGNFETKNKPSDLQRGCRPAQLGDVLSPSFQLGASIFERAIKCIDNRVRIGSESTTIVFDDQPGVTFLLARHYLAD